MGEPAARLSALSLIRKNKAALHSLLEVSKDQQFYLVLMGIAITKQAQA